MKSSPPPPSPVVEQDVRRSWGTLNTLDFTENLGQFPSGVRFVGRARGATIVLRPDGLMHELQRVVEEPREGFQHPPHPKFRAANRRIDATRAFLGFVGANPDPRVLGQSEMSYRTNYYLGADPARWRSGCKSFGMVTYEQLWPGIDLPVTVQAGDPRYDFIIGPGADPSQVVLRYEGIRALRIDSETTSLVADTALGPIVQQPPLILQRRESGLVTFDRVEGSFRIIDESTFGFEIEGEYDRSRPLIIDPVFQYGTYVSGDDEEEGGWEGVLTAGAPPKVYTAVTTSSADVAGTVLPPCLGQLYDAASDVAVLHINPAGNGSADLLWRTYLGGGGEDFVYKVGAASDGGVHVVGESAGGFPTTCCAFRKEFVGGPCDGFVAKLTAAGCLEACTYLGSGGNDQPTGVDYVRFGAGGLPRPWNPAEFLPRQQVASCPPCNPPAEEGDFVYVCSFTGSNTTPPLLPFTQGTSNSAFQPFARASAEVALTIFTPDLEAIAYSTFLSSDGVDSPYDLDVTSNGTVWIVGGQGRGPYAGQSYDCAMGHFPLGTSNPGSPPWDTVFQAPQPAGTYVEGFITHLRPWTSTPNPSPCDEDLDQLLFSSYVGGGYGTFGTEAEYVFDVHVDELENVYFAGATPSGCETFDAMTSECTGTQDFPSFNGLPESRGGRPHSDGDLATVDGQHQYDSFFGMLAPSGQRVFVSYFAGTCPDLYDTPSGKYEWAYGITADDAGRIYITGSTAAMDLPTSLVGLPAAFQATHADSWIYSVADCQLGGQHPQDNGVEYPRDAYLAVVRIAAGRPTLEYATYIGGIGDDYQYGISLDTAGNLCVGGRTESPDLHQDGVITSGAMQKDSLNTGGAEHDAWLVRFLIDDRFIRGDANLDGALTQQDLQAILDEISSPSLTCKDTADFNDDGVVNKADWTALSQYLAAPPGFHPPPECVFDTTIDPLPACVGGVCP